MKIIETLWFTEMGRSGCIGIVLVEDENTGEKKAYIGTGSGVSERGDEKLIAANGGKVTSHSADRLFNHLRQP